MLRPSPGLWRRPLNLFAALALVATATPWVEAAQGVTVPLRRNLSAAPVNGLVVKLKDAASHERLASADAGALREREATRVQQLLQQTRMTEVRTRAVGRAALHFDYGRTLSSTDAEALAAQLRARPEVEWVELNTRERLLSAAPAVPPNDTYYSYLSASDTGQWWLRPDVGATNTEPASFGVPNVQNAWLIEQGSSSAAVAVLDTGIAPHSELSGRTLPGYDFVSESVYSNDGGGRDADPSDPGDWVTQAEVDSGGAFAKCDVQASSWHGTIISGIIAAKTNNAAGVAGINWNGRILPVRVAGKCGASVTDIVDGMRWAAGLRDVCLRSDSAGRCLEFVPANQNPVKIINISFGGSAECGALYQDTIDELYNLGVVVVAAAGNESGAVTRPASCNHVVGVGALARDGLKAWYSNFGSKVVVSTVGGDDSIDDGILTVYNSGTTGPGAESYANVYGTSFATPIVAGVVSLMRSVNPSMTVAQVINGLQQSSRPHVLSTTIAICSPSNPGTCACTTNTCGAGVLDAPGAVAYARGAPVLTPDDGGGALSWVWLVGLAAGVLALWQRRRTAASGAAAAGGEGLA